MPVFLKEEDISIVLCGEAGQGIQTVEAVLAQAVKQTGYHIFSTKEYMSRVRGGENSTQIRISSDRVASYVDRIDILLALSYGAIDHLKDRIYPKTVIIGDPEHIKSARESENNLPTLNTNFIEIPLMETAEDIGGLIYANVIAAGALSCLLDIPKEIFDGLISDMFARKGPEILQNDLKAGEAGYTLGKGLMESEENQVKLSLEAHSTVRDELLLSGTDAAGMGCLAGGCKFMSSYPMTPSTPLQAFLAGNAHDFELVYEQAEDEIAAINMALGASYAGARSMVATSGSGFALMEEGVGLAGMTETPVVIYLGQRPGPAVGLPTRTSQEDLNLALYSGTGEFPRIIFAPGKLEDAFTLSQRAFNLADKYQIPVFILSDQYFADCYYNIPSLPLEEVENEDYLIKTTPNYRRYLITQDGVTPRGIPGYGDGLVILDSDEHDEEGHITENLEIRTQMVDKRLKKMEHIRKDALTPELVGSEDYENLVLGWGSTYWPIREALENIRKKGLNPDSGETSFLHLKQVYPLHSSVTNYLEKAEDVIILENNAHGQMANLIQLETGLEIQEKYLKYNGMPFSVEEVEKRLLQFMGIEDSGPGGHGKTSGEVL
ncbi:2-oxoacid:acceptor oxidoreductase subunit alpha [Methanobacterium formicicum]|jgi:2-oxoglutarate ferredoxin oxidoreductase subunit alpha|uniref:2-oxoglutarate synthase subunit KorA n=1 Tax=Methanobacterium formicicum TaxID=2162 RepID=A0A089ZVS1_METFO|nr:2-oxoacid:acceptor oxidoreductase subunit alpha [Methanobacterium formicicum]AIS32924.1 2-oxoacid ferredoxin oxidoreductase alpha subunit [Methanobacterium formicicum]CEL23863.1 2-oxoacid:acceptor oxidoreductase subunit alpha [Methanobacterium formicicum]